MSSQWGGLPAEAPEPERPASERLADVILELAELPNVEYELRRNEVAKEFGVRPTVLDTERKRLMAGSNDDDAGQGQAIKLYEPEPWPDAVNGADVLTAAAGLIGRFMVMRKTDIDACILWAAHSYLFDKFSHSPRLLITAPDAECGKTLLMASMIGNLVNRPQPVELMKPAPFFRLAQEYKPTFLIDECDVFIREDSELLGAINGGWEPHGGVMRCVGDNHEVRSFCTYTPTAMAGVKLIDKLPNTTTSRSVVIRLDRATPDEACKLLTFDRAKHKAAFIDIGRKFARWCGDHAHDIESCRPTLPDGVRNRREDKWKPLVAIADVAGGDWPARVRAAIANESEAQPRSRAVELLAAIRDVFGVDFDRLQTDDLIDRLCREPESQWASYNFKARGDEKRITAIQVAHILKPYGISPKQFKIGTVKVRGYKSEQFANAWSRYLSQEAGGTTLQPGTPVPSYSRNGSSPTQPGTLKNEVPGRIARKPNNGGGGTGVPGQNTVPPDIHDDEPKKARMVRI